jgi:MATE family multidrug resistance protein
MKIVHWKDSGLQSQIWRIAWPVTLSNISIPLLGLVDAAILGHLDSPDYLGGVAVGAAILSFLYWGFSFLRMGTTGLVARAFGAGDIDRDRQVLGQSMILALTLGGVVVLLHPWLLQLGVSLMDPGPSLAGIASSYAGIRVYSAPAVLTTYAITGWFIGHQNTRWPLVFVLITNGLNLALDFFFIIGLGMKGDGAALATLIAEYSGCALALYALARHSGYRLDAKMLDAIRRYEQYRELLVTNRHLFLRTLCLMFSFAFFTSQSAQMGPDVLAANTILLNLLLLAAHGLDGLAHASEALCGSAVGAGKIRLFYQSSIALAAWSLLIATGLSGFFLFAGHHLYPILTNISAVLALFPAYHPWLVALPIIAAGSYLMDGIFIGTSKTRYMYYTMLISTFVVYLPAWYFTQGMGNHGLWLAFTLFNGVRGVGLGYFFWRLTRREQWLD